MKRQLRGSGTISVGMPAVDCWLWTIDYLRQAMRFSGPQTKKATAPVGAVAFKIAKANSTSTCF